MRPAISPDRVALALLIGAGVGGGIVGLSMGAAFCLGQDLTTYGAGYSALSLAIGLAIAGLRARGATAVFGIGLTFVGLPIWLCLHRLGWTSPILGAGVGAVAVWGIFALCAKTPLPPSEPLLLAIIVAAMAAGWAIQSFAYRNPTPPPARSS